MLLLATGWALLRFSGDLSVCRRGSLRIIPAITYPHPASPSAGVRSTSFPLPVVAKSSSRSTWPSQRWVHRRRTRQSGAFCPFTREIPFEIAHPQLVQPAVPRPLHRENPETPPRNGNVRQYHSACDTVDSFRRSRRGHQNSSDCSCHNISDTTLETVRGVQCNTPIVTGLWQV
jgi:hypothetical protein